MTGRCGESVAELVDRSGHSIPSDAPQPRRSAGQHSILVRRSYAVVAPQSRNTSLLSSTWPWRIRRSAADIDRAHRAGIGIASASAARSTKSDQEISVTSHGSAIAPNDSAFRRGRKGGLGTQITDCFTDAKLGGMGFH